MKIFFSVFMMALFLGAAAFFQGCQSGPPPELSRKPRYELIFYPIVPYPRGRADEFRLANNDSTVWVEGEYCFHSSYGAEDITMVCVDSARDLYDLRLKLSKRGSRWWDTMIDYHYGEKIAVALDKKLLTVMSAYFLSEEEFSEKSKVIISAEPPEYAMLHGPFNATIAAEIAQAAKFNFAYYPALAKERERQAKERDDVDPFEDEEAYERKKREERIKELHPSEESHPFSF